MRPTYHVILSGGVTAVFSIWVRSWDALAACFLSGIFIDLDHHLDYFIATKKIPFSYSKLLNFFQSDKWSKVYFFLHSYEVISLIWVSIFVFDLNAVWLGVAVGFTGHLFCDEIANPLSPLSYFLIYRAKNRFDRKAFFKKGHDH